MTRPTERNAAIPRSVTVIRRLEVVALCLSAIALLLCLLFVWHTTGGSLFVFSVAAPAMVLIATVIVAATAVHEFRQAHRLFAVERLDPDQVVFRQGEPGDCAYFIREGRVEVVDDERGAVMATLGPGEYFGEMALLGDLPRNATVRTVSAVELAVLGKDNFLHMIHLVPATEEAILTTVRKRAMGTTRGESRAEPGSGRE